MSELDICTLGAATLNSTTNVPSVEVLREFGLDDEESEPLGEAALVQCLGFTSLPAGPTDDGHADGIVMTPCGSYASGIIGGTDTRCADVIGTMKPGESCAHNTGGTPETRARTFWKENCCATIVGSDTAVIIDRKNEKITITGFGHVFEMSSAQGIVMMAKGGKNGIKLLEDGSVWIWGTSVNLGGMLTPGTPATKVLMGPVGIAGVPSPNVYITI